ncbi:tRNA (adenine-N(1)-)-methyltransferase catalytic subunit trm61 [Elasticomyces elasticus]|nr:tRNA (adenine-N(1)-)-methyltransferase catalytic subunit trm61 [Elasticomyces elasticus]
MAQEIISPSPFFHPGKVASQDSLAVLHLKRDLLLPITLRASSEATDGYAEGAVTNTRFGSFPHSTLLGLPWGTQVLASKVDTGSRGRPGKKRKLEDRSPQEEQLGTKQSGEERVAVKAAVAAGSGFAHLLPPTPESWTISLPHRTQVVYTPDYSYILQRLRVRPGDTIIEAGAGSGSFTHAAARAVYNGLGTAGRKRKRQGRVFSFEYHEPRVVELKREIKEHGLDSVVTVTHRDVYQDGFNIATTPDEQQERPLPCADAIFLDLPAPWQALPHLTRTLKPVPSPTPAMAAPTSDSPNDITMTSDPIDPAKEDVNATQSPLNPEATIRVCTFSPCIEQVQQTVTALRRLGWVDVEMVEVMHKRIDVRRERVGLHEEGLRGVNASASTVEEATDRLREIETRFKDFHSGNRDPDGKRGANKGVGEKEDKSKKARLDRIKADLKHRKIYKEGRLVHRTEPELKTHTSYLVFAILPMEWTQAEEDACEARWPVASTVPVDKESHKTKSK